MSSKNCGRDYGKDHGKDYGKDHGSDHEDYGNDLDHKPICTYEQEIEAYFQVAGLLESPTGDTGGVREKSVLINRNLRISADDDVLVLRRSTLPGAPELRFTNALVVLPPDLKKCSRDSECKRIIRYIEQSAYIDIADLETYRVDSCDAIVALDGVVYFVSGFLRCDCEKKSLTSIIRKLAALRLPFLRNQPSGPYVELHLRSSVPI